MNRIWRRSRHSTYLDPKVKSWKALATAELLRQRVGKRWHTITGSFAVTMTICRKKLRKNADIDNRYKVLGDFAQDVGIIANDKNCIRLVIEFGEAPLGCRVCFLEVEP